MTAGSRARRLLLVSPLVLSLALPMTSAPAVGAGIALGTARGIRSAELSLDGGTSWLSLKGRSLPLVAGSRVRSTTGAVSIELADGARLTLQPFSAATLKDSADVVLEYGRAGFRLAPASPLGLATAVARLETSGGAPAAGEVVAARGATGVRVTQGSLLLREANGTPRIVRAGGGPAMVPGTSPADAAFPVADAAAPAPAGARVVFTPEGENVGYVEDGRRLVVRPGFAADLSARFPARTVEQASARVPPASRGEALLLLDANGGYAGYVADAVFYSASTAMPVAAAAAAAAPGTSGQGAAGGQQSGALGDSQWPWHYTVGLLAIVGGTVALVIANDDAASPVGP